MPGVPPEVACHHLNVDPSFKPIKKKHRRSAPQHKEAVKEEVARLLEELQKGPVPNLVFKYGGDDEEDGKLKGACGLYQPE